MRTIESQLERQRHDAAYQYTMSSLKNAFQNILNPMSSISKNSTQFILTILYVQKKNSYISSNKNILKNNKLYSLQEETKGEIENPRNTIKKSSKQLNKVPLLGEALVKSLYFKALLIESFKEPESLSVKFYNTLCRTLEAPALAIILQDNPELKDIAYDDADREALYTYLKGTLCVNPSAACLPKDYEAFFSIDEPPNERRSGLVNCCKPRKFQIYPNRRRRHACFYNKKGYCFTFLVTLTCMAQTEADSVELREIRQDSYAC